MSEEGKNQLDPCGILETNASTKLAASVCIYQLWGSVWIDFKDIFSLI